MPEFTADFTFHTSDNLPPIDVRLRRQGDSPGDYLNLTNSSASCYIRQLGGSALLISGSAAVLGAAANGIYRFLISGAASGSAGFSTPGQYVAQFVISWSSGRETVIEDVGIEVRRSYRTS